MIGYKATDKNGCCRGFKYEVGKTYTKDTPKEKLECCTDKVFHFCREIYAIEKTSEYNLAESRLFEVISGDFVQYGNIYGTNSLTILREIEGKEKLDIINSGNCNSGIRNSGNYNSGNWNSGDWNSGFFNSDEPCLRMFNKMTYCKRDDINIPSWCYFDLTVWVSYDTATEKEKKKYKNEIEICGGFLKTIDYKDAWRLAWNKASIKERKKLFELPNWDNEVFKEITGIDAEKEILLN